MAGFWADSFRAVNFFADDFWADLEDPLNPSQPIAFRVTMHSNPIAMVVKLMDNVGFHARITDTIAARTNMTDTFFARTTIQLHELAGITSMVDHVGFRTKMTDYLAATVRTPGVD